MKNTNFIAIDFETATVKRAPCQIGIAVVKCGEITEKISRLIQPPRNRYSVSCVAVHGITPEMTANAPAFDKVWDEIKEYFEGNFIVAHNASFDLNVLEKALAYYHLPRPRIMGYACTFQLSGIDLEKACKTYGIELCDHHDGACDAEACALLFLKYLNREIDFANQPEEPDEGMAKGFDSNLSEYRSQIRLSAFKPDLENADHENPFYGKRVVITGVFGIERMDLAQRLSDMGAKVCSSINSKTDFVVTGTEPGQKKLETLKQLLQEGHEITRIYEEQLIRILGGY